LFLNRKNKQTFDAFCCFVKQAFTILKPILFTFAGLRRGNLFLLSLNPQSIKKNHKKFWGKLILDFKRKKLDLELAFLKKKLET